MLFVIYTTKHVVTAVYKSLNSGIPLLKNGEKTRWLEFVLCQRLTVSFLLNHWRFCLPTMGKMMMTVSCQNSVLLQPILHLIKVFQSSDLPALQFTHNFANLYESS